MFDMTLPIGQWVSGVLLMTFQVYLALCGRLRNVFSPFKVRLFSRGNHADS